MARLLRYSPYPDWFPGSAWEPNAERLCLQTALREAEPLVMRSQALPGNETIHEFQLILVPFLVDPQTGNRVDVAYTSEILDQMEEDDDEDDESSDE
jgi:hypothetical protein